MRKLTFLFATAMIAFTSKAVAQDDATATSSATIVTPISITKSADMNFGNVAVTATAGTVILDPAGTRTTTGGVTLPATSGSVAAASFDVAGEGSYTYDITLPTGDHTIEDAAATPNTMVVNAFSSDPSGTGQLTTGAQVLKVGATLNVGAGQTSGTYTSATPFTVTVNYN